jgi:hypothetical protein
MRETQPEVPKKLDIRQRRLLAYQTPWIQKTVGLEECLSRDPDFGTESVSFPRKLQVWLDFDRTGCRGDSKIGDSVWFASTC